jgi:endonuclease/exonuclease/phosphatase family metal-dependent hydrolase
MASGNRMASDVGPVEETDAATGSATDPSLTVTTRNLYVGVDLSRLFGAGTLAEVRRVAGELLAELRSHPFAARMGAVADEVAATRPDVIGLQEAALVRSQQPGDFADAPYPNATDVVVDLLDLLSSALESRRLSYEVAAATVTTDLEVPADVDGDRIDVRLTDRTAILVREGVETGGTRTGTFDAAHTFPVSSAGVLVRRGYCLAAVTAGDAAPVVATAHLESTDAEVRRRQAAELRKLLPTDRPVLLAGDFNSGPGGRTDAYDSLTETFADAHAALRPAEEGPTCCQSPDLRNERSLLSRRVDAVLSRGARPAAVERVGADPEERVPAEVDGETVRVWPSDHAGVVATLAVPTATRSSTPTATSTGTTTSGGTATPTRQRSPTATTGRSPDGDTGTNVSLPGFGPLGTVGALVGAALVRRRHAESVRQG